MELQCLKIELPEDVQIILTQSHFVKTVEDVSECLHLLYSCQNRSR